MKRASGLLLPVTSIPSKYGIGCFSKEAYQWIDQLKEAGQSYWQILPLAPTSYGDSPYQSFSSFAGNPYFIDLEQLIEEGVLTAEECDDAHFMKIERVEDEFFISSNHEMTKSHFISFIAVVRDNSCEIIKMYPEGNCETRLKISRINDLYFYCNHHGLFKLNIKKAL